MIHPELPHKYSSSWRNHQRILFIKGFFTIHNLIQEMYTRFKETGKVEHEMVDILLEHHLRELKDLSHELYRVPEEAEEGYKQQRLFDKVFGEMWHELDKARDNIRLLEAYSDPHSHIDDKLFRSASRLEGQILSAARKDLPRQLRRVKRLLDVLIPLYEKILPLYYDNDIIVRTIYFSRNEMDSYCKPSTVGYFFPVIFGSIPHGYLHLMQSLVKTKHFSYAQSVLEELRVWSHNNPHSAETLRTAEQELKAALR